MDSPAEPFSEVFRRYLPDWNPKKSFRMTARGIAEYTEGRIDYSTADRLLDPRRGLARFNRPGMYDTLCEFIPPHILRLYVDDRNVVLRDSLYRGPEKLPSQHSSNHAAAEPLKDTKKPRRKPKPSSAASALRPRKKRSQEQS